MREIEQATGWPRRMLQRTLGAMENRRMIRNEGAAMLPVDVRDPTIRVIIPSGEDRLYDVAERALADQMYVIHNGSTILVCSIIPAGWKKLAVKDKTPNKIPQIYHSSAIGGVLSGVPALPALPALLKMGA